MEHANIDNALHLVETQGDQWPTLAKQVIQALRNHLDHEEVLAGEMGHPLTHTHLQAHRDMHLSLNDLQAELERDHTALNKTAFLDHMRHQLITHVQEYDSHITRDAAP